jgi:hypothetical protein
MHLENLKELHLSIAEFALLEKERVDAINRLHRANAEMKDATSHFHSVEKRFVQSSARLQAERNKAFDLHPWTESDQSTWIGS